MADIIDEANELAEETAQRAIREVRSKAASIPKGDPGDCDLCGEWSGRLVEGACAPCRDRWRLA